MADGRIDILEDGTPSKFLASQTHTHGADTVHAEEIVIVDSAGNLVNVTANRLLVDGSGVTQPVSDAGGSITVDALNLDIRDLVAASDEVGARLRDGAGVDFGTPSNPVRVKGANSGTDGDTFVPNTSDGYPIMGAREDTGPSTLAEDDLGILRATQARALHVNLRGDTGTEIGTSTTPVRTDPTGVTTQPVSGTVNVGTFPDNEPFNLGQVGGTSTVTGGVAGLLAVAGNVAHDGVDAGNPVKIGGKASGAAQTAVAAADRVDAYLDREGRVITRPWGAGDWTQVHFPAANTQATASRTAGGAGVRHVCTGLTAVLAGNTTAPAAAQVNVALRDGASGAGTILWQAVITLPAVAGAMNGISRSGLFIRGTAATAMTLEFSAAGGANTFESVSMEGIDITEA